MMKTDIYDLGYIYFSIGKENEQFLNRDIDNRFAGNYFLGGCDFFLRLFYYFIRSPWRFKKTLKKENSVLIYGESTNNRNTLLPIILELGNESVVDLNHHSQYPKWKLYWYAIPHLGKLIREIRKNNPERRSTIKNFFPKFWVMYGCNKLAGKLLDYYKPRALVLANDHLYFHRSLMHEANARGISTIYVQHAAVTEKFPPLGFSYSLLDGVDSYLKYKLREQTKGKIYLSGGIRFDAIKSYARVEPEVITVGVAINLVDDERLTKECCVKLRQQQLNDGTHINVILRPHPQMALDEWRGWCEENGIGFSVAREEPSFAFLSRISVLVSNQSSIHLDAAMCHVPSVVYGLSTAELNDSYSFVKNGLVCKAENFEELSEFIIGSKEYKYKEDVVRYYNGSYGSSYECNVAKMMADLIESIPDKVESFNTKYHFEKMFEDEKKIVYKTI